MKPLSETYKELGIAFSLPILVVGLFAISICNLDREAKEIKDAKGNQTYYEASDGTKRGTPRSETCEGKVIEVDGIKYELKAL